MARAMASIVWLVFSWGRDFPGWLNPMAKSEVARLFRAAQENSTLRDRLQAAPNLATFLTLAADLGYTFTEEEWREMTRFSVEEVPSQLSEIPGI